MQPNMPPQEQPATSAPGGAGPLPRQIHVASILLIVNLALSVVVTILYVVDRHGIIRTVRDENPKLTLAQARRDVTIQTWTRGGISILVGLLYLFYISRLRLGRRWAWRRLIWLSVIGGLGIVFLLTQPYPAPFKVEQVLQLLVLAGIAACVLHPDVRRHYAKR